MIVHKPSGKLLLNLNDPGRVTTVIPSARLLQYQGRNIVAVPHKEDEVRVLRNLGFDAPAPIEHHYQWVGRHPPFQHQVATAAFLTLNPWSFCLNGMGSGKTLAVLWAYHYLKQRGQARRMLVVAPLSTLVRTWGDEVFSHFTELTTAVLHGTMDRRLKLLAVPHDIYIVNHDGIKSKELLTALEAREDIDVVVIDEVASFRTASTERYKAAARLVAGRKYVWGLTGTPTPNAPTDAWAQCKLIAPTRVPKYFGAFRDQVMKPMGPFKWVPRDAALDIVKQAMQPAIRFSREDCIDLPPTMYQTREVELTPEQRKAFDSMLKTLRAEYEGGQVLAVNEAVKLGKLVQICCLSANTSTLTRRGWVRIVDVLPDDQLWDGVEWVRHEGLVYRGQRETISRAGISLTPDHLVLTDSGWVEAQRIRHADAGTGLDWTEVRLPASHTQGGIDYGAHKVRDLALSLRLWARGGQGEPESSEYDAPERAELRVPTRAVGCATRHVQESAVPHLDADTRSVPGSLAQGLGKLRRAWDSAVRSVGGVIYSVLERHAAWVRPAAVSRARGQRWPVLQGELPLGDFRGTGPEQAQHHVRRHSEGAHDFDGGGRGVQHSSGHASAPDSAVQLDCGPSTDDTRCEAVYDLINCGPRTRFTVCGPGQRPLLVHNCGVAYNAAGGETVIPAKPRIDVVHEIIEEAEGKVIVFVPLTGALEHLAAELGKHYSVEVVHGGTSKTERDRIFGAFQKHKDPHVLVANAGAMSHGLTLTASNTIVWYGPPTSNEIYTQANARIVRPGQKLNTLIVHIESTPVEKKMFDRLRKKGTMQGALLDLLKGD